MSNDKPSSESVAALSEEPHIVFFPEDVLPIIDTRSLVVTHDVNKHIERQKTIADGNITASYVPVSLAKRASELAAKQAELITEIERLKSQLKDYCNDCQHPTVNERQAAELSKLRQENERYKEALQCMMNVEHHGDFMNAFFDLKDQVEAALKGE